MDTAVSHAQALQDCWSQLYELGYKDEWLVCVLQSHVMPLLWAGVVHCGLAVNALPTASLI